MPDRRRKNVALLHDVIEDTNVTASALLNAGFPPTIVEAVLPATRNEGESHDDFVIRSKQNPIGRQI